MQEERPLPVNHIKKKRRLRKPRVATVLFVSVLAMAVFFGFAYFQSRDDIRRLERVAAQSPEQEANTLVAKISAYMVLPSEKPTIATVEDTKKLADQPFFKHARKGDKVLMYTDSKKAILYRPSEDKIIEVAHLNAKKEGM